MIECKLVDSFSGNNKHYSWDIESDGSRIYMIDCDAFRVADGRYTLVYFVYDSKSDRVNRLPNQLFVGELTESRALALITSHLGIEVDDGIEDDGWIVLGTITDKDDDGWITLNEHSPRPWPLSRESLVLSRLWDYPAVLHAAE